LPVKKEKDLRVESFRPRTAVLCIAFILCISSQSYATCTGSNCITMAECDALSCDVMCPQWAGGLPGQVTCSCSFGGTIYQGTAITVLNYVTCTDIIHGITGEPTQCGGCGYSTGCDPLTDPCCGKPDDPCCGSPDPCCGSCDECCRLSQGGQPGPGGNGGNP
jgi:hypothetical protein